MEKPTVHPTVKVCGQKALRPEGYLLGSIILVKVTGASSKSASYTSKCSFPMGLTLCQNDVCTDSSTYQKIIVGKPS